MGFLMICIGIKTQYATCILSVRSAVHPSLSNRVFMVASEPDLPERAGRGPSGPERSGTRARARTRSRRC